MRALTIAFALGALVCGLTAAFYWHRSSLVEAIPSADPVVAEVRNQVWFAAILAAAEKSAGLNKVAARWTAASVILGAASSICGSLI